MKIRARMDADKSAADIKVLVNHPMETGQRKDANGELIPRHFIQHIKATHNGNVVVDAQWSQAISKNPFFGFKIKGAKPGDAVAVSWVDNKGDASSIDAKIEPA